MERATEKMNSILQETESKIEQAIKEIEQEQEK
jgi:predicted DNA-binding transcriptional regulator